jgi:hypothetical protein
MTTNVEILKLEYEDELEWEHRTDGVAEDIIMEDDMLNFENEVKHDKDFRDYLKWKKNDPNSFENWMKRREG